MKNLVLIRNKILTSRRWCGGIRSALAGGLAMLPGAEVVGVAAAAGEAEGLAHAARAVKEPALGVATAWAHRNRQLARLCWQQREQKCCFFFKISNAHLCLALYPVVGRRGLLMVMMMNASNIHLRGLPTCLHC